MLCGWAGQASIPQRRKCTPVGRHKTNSIMLLPDQIKEILKDSGYLFEQKAASIVEKLEFDVQTNRAYQDSDEGKSREIDIVAHKTAFKIEKFNTHGVCYLFCECKNSNTPFVFFTRKKGLLDKYFTPREFHFVHERYFKEEDTFKSTALGAFSVLGLMDHHYYTKSNIKAVQLCKIVRNNSRYEAQHSGVVEGILYPLVKSYLSLFPNTPNSTDLIKYCKLCFNIVIVNSDLYTIDTEDEDALPKKVNFVPFLREIRSNNIDGSFLITFVTFNYLEQFIKEEILGFCNIVGEKYASDDKFLLSPSLSSIL